MTQEHFPLSGEIGEDGRHRLVQRVYYEDTDFSGRVYHARYLHFLERGRTDYLRCLGVEQGALAGSEDAIVFVVGRMEIDFKGPAVMDDIVTIQTHTSEAGGARLTIEQDIRVGEKLLIAAKVSVVAIAPSGRPRRLPADLAARFLAH